MDAERIFYLSGIIVCGYAFWLLAFRTYKVDFFGKPTGYRLLLPRVMYILAAIILFVPWLNIVAGTGFFAVALICTDDMYVDSWLFRKPGEKRSRSDDET